MKKLRENEAKFMTKELRKAILKRHFSSCESIRKTEKIQKHCLRVVLNNYESDYETLLRNSKKPAMEIRRLRTLAVEIFKTLNESNLPYIKNIFTPKKNSKAR